MLQIPEAASAPNSFVPISKHRDDAINATSTRRH
jgi:hypothetical protein